VKNEGMAERPTNRSERESKFEILVGQMRDELRAMPKGTPAYAPKPFMDTHTSSGDCPPWFPKSYFEEKIPTPARYFLGMTKRALLGISIDRVFTRLVAFQKKASDKCGGAIPRPASMEQSVVRSGFDWVKVE